MANQKKRLKECWDMRFDPNKNMEESKKRSLLIQSEAMDNTNNSSIKPPANHPPPPTRISVGGEGRGFSIASPSNIGGGTSLMTLMTKWMTS